MASLDAASYRFSMRYSIDLADYGDRLRQISGRPSGKPEGLFFPCVPKCRALLLNEGETATAVGQPHGQPDRIASVL